MKHQISCGKTKRETGFSARFWELWTGYSRFIIRGALNGKASKRPHYKSKKYDTRWAAIAKERGIKIEVLASKYKCPDTYLAHRYIMEDYKTSRDYWSEMDRKWGRREWELAKWRRPKRVAKRKSYLKPTTKKGIESKIKRALYCRARALLKKMLRAKKHTTPVRARMAKRIREHIESQFTKGMTWENWGRGTSCKREWHLDHIVPISKFDIRKKSELARANHWTNLRPMWADENQKKGAKIPVGAGQLELITEVY